MFKHAFRGTRLSTGGLILFLGALAGAAQAHPTIEGGLKQGFHHLKGYPAGLYIELVADPVTQEVRIYISLGSVEQINGKKHEWVQNLTVRHEAVGGGQDHDLLPVPDPGSGLSWFPVAAVRKAGGYVFYRIEVSARVKLDKNAAQALTFAAGVDAQGTHCLKAALANLSSANSIRFEQVKVVVKDAKDQKKPWERDCYIKMCWGLGQLWKKLPRTDVPLSKFKQTIRDKSKNDKHRKPEAPAHSAANTAAPVAPAPTSAAQPKAAPTPSATFAAKSAPEPPADTAWEEELLRKIQAALAAGQKPVFYLNAMRTRVKVVGVSGDSLKLESRGIEITFSISQLMPSDRSNVESALDSTK